MATQIKTTSLADVHSHSQSGRDSLLRNVLKGNAAFSTLSGLLFIVAASAVADFIGLADGATYVQLMGIGLLTFAVFVYFVATRRQINHMMAQEVIVMDFAWVIGSGVMLLTDVLELSTEGNWGVLIIADIVLTFAILQIVGLRRMRQN